MPGRDHESRTDRTDAAPSAAPSAAATGTPSAAPSAAPTAAATPGATAGATTATTPPPTPVPSAAPSASAGAAAPDLTTTAYAPEPPGQTGGSLILGQWQYVDAVNPYYFQAFTDVQAFGALSFNSLVNTTQDLKYIPDLAQEVPLISNGGVTVDGERMSVNWRLKPGMKWSDGQPITCADLEATWQWNMHPDNTGLAGGTTGWEDIESVDRRFLRPSLVELIQDGGGGSALFDHLGSLAEPDSGRRVSTGSLVDPYTGL